jgi:4-hydroxy-tetrahydrodipicolinate reductase
MTLPIVLSGLPGRMASLSAEAIVRRPEFRLVGRAFSGKARTGSAHRFALEDGREVSLALLGPLNVADLRALAQETGALAVLDFSTPDAATPNALACAEAGIPFATGTSGLDRERVRAAATQAGIPAVAAANFAPALAVLDAALRWAAFRFPGALEGLELSVRESHQAQKRDISGTARAFARPLARLTGKPFDEETIQAIRDPATQRALGIPEAHLDGHGWHRFAMEAPDGSASLTLETRVLGRSLYVQGALRALRFLAAEAAAWRDAGTLGQPGRGDLFSMEDVLAAAERVEPPLNPLASLNAAPST